MIRVYIYLFAMGWLAAASADTGSEAAIQVDENKPSTQQEKKNPGGRVIEYGEKVSGGVVQAKPMSEPSDKQTESKNVARKTAADRKKQSKSVKLITGGDPTEGSAKVGRLPVLD